MAQHRQPAGSFFHKVGLRNAHVSLGVRTHNHKQPRTRRFRTPRISLTALLFVVFAIIFLVSASAFLYLSKDKDDYKARNDESGSGLDFLANVTRTERSKVLKFGHGSFGHGRDSRYWDRDDRRRNEDYSEDSVDHSKMGNKGGSVVNFRIPFKRPYNINKISEESKKRLDHGAAGLYNEAGRNELKMYEAAYEATLKGAVLSTNKAKNAFQRPDRMDKQKHQEDGDAFDEYEDEIDMHDNDDIRLEDYNTGLEKGNRSGVGISHGLDGRRSSVKDHSTGQIEETVSGLSGNVSLDPLDSDKVKTASRHVEVIDDRSVYERKIASKKRSKRRKFSGSCEMKVLNSTTLLVEPLKIRKFARFSLQYVEREEKPNKLEEPWEPRFAGHQSLEQREQSFIARDQKIHCGFVKGPKGAPSTGFDLDEDDEKFLRSCHIAVVSCIFGNSDRLRSPMGKTVSRLSRKNVCFVMFVDDVTLQTLSSEGHITDKTGYIGLWKTVLVKNLPYTDMRRVGKITKLLSHRLFPSARYSIWLDSKLRLQLDPLLVLEYLLWRKGHEYAISNHYDRHCVWEEVAQNKKLNKYNHTVIDEQFAFYQVDGMTKFNPMDPQKLLPSNVPEGSFIARAHTPMSNLFSCLWFNEVERFTPRDQLSFAYTYRKLRTMNPSKPFYFNMFKDCERRKMAKLFRHRSEERRYTVG